MDNCCSVDTKLWAYVYAEDKIRKSVIPLPWTTVQSPPPLPPPPPISIRSKCIYEHAPSVRRTAEVIEASISLPALQQILITLSWDPSHHSSVSFSMLVQSHFSQPIIKDKVILSLPRRGTQIEISSVYPICLVSLKSAPCILFH